MSRQSFVIKHKNGSQVLKSHNTLAFQKIASDACQAAPVTQSVSSELSPTAIMYSLLCFKSTQHFQNFSYVTWAHPAISWAITLYLNLGNILRRSPPHRPVDLMVTFAFFWEQSIAFNRGCPCVVFGFQITTKTRRRSLRIYSVTWFKECFHDSSSWEHSAARKHSWPTQCYSFKKTKHRTFFF